MRRLLGSVLPALLLVALLGGCGEEDSGTATDDPTTASSTPTDEPTDTPTDTPTEQPTDEPTDKQGEPVEFELVETISETAGEGTTSPVGVPLGDAAAVDTFVSELSGPLQDKVRFAVATTDVPDDMRLYGAVVAVGCDAPTEVAVVQGASGLEIHALKVPNPLPECFAPVTTVALVLVPTSAVG